MERGRGWSCVARRVLTEASPTPAPPGLPQTVLRAAPTLSAPCWAAGGRGGGMAGGGRTSFGTPPPLVFRTCPRGLLSSCPTRAPRPPRGQSETYLGTQGDCRAPLGWPLLGRMCSLSWGRAGNDCASLDPLQGQGNSGNRRTRVPKASSPAPLEGGRAGLLQGAPGRSREARGLR